MAAEDCVFEATSSVVAQVHTCTPGGTIEADDLFLVRLTNEAGQTNEISVAAGGTTVQSVVEALQTEMAARAALGIAPWNEVTAIEDDAKVTLTADTPGVPFWISVSTTEAGGGAADAQTFATASVTAVTGPGIYSDADNWVSQTAPDESGDCVFIKPGLASKIYGEDASGVTLEDWKMKGEHSGAVGGDGHPLYIKGNASPGTSEAELSCTGVGRFRIDAFDTVRVVNARSSPSIGRFGTEIYGVEIKNLIVDLADESGTVGFCPRADQIGEMDAFWLYRGLLTIGVGLVTTATVYNVTETDGSTAITNGYVNGGECQCWASIVTLAITGGIHYQHQGSITTPTVEGGTLVYNSLNNLTTISLYGGAVLDLSQNDQSKTVTVVKVYSPDVTIIDPYGYITEIETHKCALSDLNLTVARDVQWTKAAIS